MLDLRMYRARVCCLRVMVVVVSTLQLEGYLSVSNTKSRCHSINLVWAPGRTDLLSMFSRPSNLFPLNSSANPNRLQPGPSQCRVFCLAHRSYGKHGCPKANAQNVTVVICPLCAKGVRLLPTEDPNISWESHVNTECDPSNYESRTKKRKCPVPGCRESLTFSNTIRCRDCTVDHCLKHRFGPDHKCPGPKKSAAGSGFPFISLLSKSQKEKPRSNQNPASSTKWTTSLFSAASSFRASAEASMTKWSNATSQALNMARDGMGQSSSGDGGGQVEVCPQCQVKFSSVTSLVEHVKKVHEASSSREGVRDLAIDVCPKCSKGFRDPVALVEHVEREHRGTSKA